MKEGEEEQKKGSKKVETAEKGRKGIGKPQMKKELNFGKTAKITCKKSPSEDKKNALQSASTSSKTSGQQQQPTPAAAAVASVKDMPEVGSKYFVCVKIGKKTVVFMVDTGAQTSLLATNESQYLEKKQLRKPVKLRGFNNQIGSICHSYVEDKAEFVPGSLKLRFLVTDIPYSIIGTDILKNRNLKISLETDTGILRVGTERIQTSATEVEARAAYAHRRREQEVGDGGVSGVLRLADEVILPPHEILLVKATISGKRLTGELIFYSHYDLADKNIFIPSIAMEGNRDIYPIPVQNKTGRPVKLPKAMIFGRVWDSLGIHTLGVDMEVVDVSELMADEIEKKKNPDGKKSEMRPDEPEVAGNASNSGKERNVEVGISVIENKTVVVEPDDRDDGCNENAVKFTQIAGQTDISNETLQKAFKQGVWMNIKGKTVTPSSDLSEVPDLDMEKEKERHAKSVFWPEESRQEFNEQFNLTHLSKEVAARVLEILWSYRDNFYRESKPEMFHAKIRAKPIELRLKPGMTPRRMKQREMSAEKTEYMRKHINQLLEQDVIEEIDSSEGCYISPAHVVIESRYIASQKKTIIKTRLVVDMRAVNACMEEYTFPLPLTESLRREIAAGYNVYSCFDATSYFFQHCISNQSKRLCCFYALNRVFQFKSLIMGIASSPSYCQEWASKSFRCHPNCFPYLDDFTIRSVDDEEHLERDLPLFLALVSYYRLLLKGPKSDLLVKSARVLGHEVGASSLALTAEKVEKIKALEFPVTKKALISALAFFAYFILLSPRLAELLAPLRKFASAKVRYTPNEELKKVFENAKAHLLSEEVGAIRTPSAHEEDTIFLFTDASANAMSALLCQVQYKSVERKGSRHLFIIGVWSGTVPKTTRTLPIWMMELFALYSAVRRWSFVLWSKIFYCCTDSGTVCRWSNLDLIPMDLARRIIHLQKFQYRILYVSTNLNPADVLSRQDGETAPTGSYPSFAEGRIVNADGEIIPLERLFSAEKREEMKNFFAERRQPMAKPSTIESLREEAEEQNRLDEDEISKEIEFVERGDHEIIFERDAAEEEEDSVKMAMVDAVFDDKNVAAIALDDDDFQAGRSNDEQEEPIDEEFASVEFTPVEEERRLEVKGWQDSSTLNAIKEYIQNDLPSPSKLEVMALGVEMRHFFNHRTLFKLKDGVLYRLWVDKEGNAKSLVVLSDKALHEMLAKMHSETHAGFRQSFAKISSTFYSFNMRKYVQRYIAACPSCVLNNYPKGQVEKGGNHLVPLPNDLVVADFVGPLQNHKTTTGSPKYILVFVDGHSRYTHAFVCTSTRDSEVLRCLSLLRLALAGLPRKISIDNVLIKENTQSAEYLRSNGVSILHGLAHISRSQSKAERVISTLSRLICKFETSHPGTRLEKLLEMALVAYNGTPHRSLPRHMAPRDLHFRQPPSTFFDVSRRPLTVDGKLGDALKACDETFRNEVFAHLRNRQRVSPTDFSARIKIGDLALKKRTSFKSSAPKKYQHKVIINGYRVIKKLATNVYRLQSIIDGSEVVLPGEQIVRLKHHSEESLKALVKEMNSLSQGAEAKTNPMTLRRRRKLEASIDKQSTPKSRALDGVEDFGGKKKKRPKKPLKPTRQSERIKNRS